MEVNLLYAMDFFQSNVTVLDSFRGADYCCRSVDLGVCEMCRQGENE